MTIPEAQERTDLVMEEILFHQNGYSREEIKKKELAKDCRGSELYLQIFGILKAYEPCQEQY